MSSATQIKTFQVMLFAQPAPIFFRVVPPLLILHCLWLRSGKNCLKTFTPLNITFTREIKTVTQAYSFSKQIAKLVSHELDKL